MAGEAAGGKDFDAAHRALLADPTLQFKFGDAPPPPAPPPDWLQAFFRALAKVIEALAPALNIVFMGCLALGLAMIIWIIVREVMTRAAMLRAKKDAAAAPETVVFQPSKERASVLLTDADRLAAEGRFGEAVRVLLHRSIEDIEKFANTEIGPAATSREISRLSVLSSKGRTVFSMLSDAVESAFFAERAIGADEFQQCREAYRGFAFGEGAR